MHRFAKATAVLVLLLMAGAPLVACIVPGTAGNADDQACCRDMAGQCGADEMPASHSCCQKLAGPAQPAMAKSSFHLQHLALALYLAQPIVSCLASADTKFASFINADHSPPELTSSSPDILRI